MANASLRLSNRVEEEMLNFVGGRVLYQQAITSLTEVPHSICSRNRDDAFKP
jgi:hypothetical protein